MSTAVAAGEDLAHQTLAVLYQHRLATSAQIHALVAPNAGERRCRTRLQALEKQGLVGAITLPLPGRTRVWHLTDYGRATCQDWPELRDSDCPPTTSDPTAVRLRTAHTLTVLRAHLAFLNDARRRGDEYGPLDWVPEVHHRLTEHAGDAVIADALLRYTAHTATGRIQLRAFVEVDRATMSSERLASKLISYTRFLTYTPQAPGRRNAAGAQDTQPLWQRKYPRFPRVLFILTGAGPTALRHRIEDLQAMAQEPGVARLVRQVPVGAAVLEDLEEHGPTAPVWTSLAGRTGTCGWIDL